ncbi:MFS general substrate transporter [Calocera viscosa TUFC12733]|uniref:MFS general substrate transporter n=1 Tax=Calocera viscosa (strain TUFC12733) TaxID=1330018 RepID=A0A167RK27_CALVF|nr:MFS general substrate transporter [Calocera viscosa TUFC12733]
MSAVSTPSHEQGLDAEKHSEAEFKDHAPQEPAYPLDPAFEQKLVRKLDKMIVPTLMGIYLFAYLDRGNIGNARLQGLPQDILNGDPSGALFAWLSAAFYFAYVIFQYPATIYAKKFKQHYWIATACFGWGLVSLLQATTFNFGSIFMCRFTIGFFESMFGPNIAAYFTYFYTREEIGRRIGIWWATASVAGAFGGLLAYGVQHIHYKFNPWRFLFIIEGAPAMLIGIAIPWILPDRPEESTKLTEPERALAIARMKRGGSPEVARTLSWAHVRMALYDWKIYCAGITYFGTNCALSALGSFLPTIINQMGYSAANAQLLTVPPYAVGGLSLCIMSFVSDRYYNRGIPMIVFTAIGGTGYLILCVAPTSNVAARYAATFLVTMGTYTCIGIAIAWYPFNMGSESKRAMGIPIWQSIGQCGSILGSYIYPNTDAPRFIRGFAVTCGLFYFSTAVAIVLSAYIYYENARRDRVHGKVDPNAEVDTSELADYAPNFRYVP